MQSLIKTGTASVLPNCKPASAFTLMKHCQATSSIVLSRGGQQASKIAYRGAPVPARAFSYEPRRPRSPARSPGRRNNSRSPGRSARA